MKQAIFFGNCQAAALQRILADHMPFASTYEVIPVRAVHVLTEHEKSALLDSVAQSDLVIHQPVSNVYAPATTENIVAAVRPGAKSITFPVCWFDGYFPDMTYLRGSASGPTPSEYHSRIIFRAYVSGHSPEWAAGAYERPDLYPPDVLSGIVDRNVATLAGREASLDVKLSELVASKYRDKNLFFTFNHPTGHVLYYLADTMLQMLDLPPLAPNVKKAHVSALAGFRWQGAPAVFQGLKLQFPALPFFFARGKQYRATEFARAWFDYYDANPNLVATHENLGLNGALL